MADGLITWLMALAYGPYSMWPTAWLMAYSMAYGPYSMAYGPYSMADGPYSMWPTAWLMAYSMSYGPYSMVYRLQAWSIAYRHGLLPTMMTD